MYISEIGLNHLGSSKKLMNYVHNLNDTNVDALTVQIREPGYYIINPNLELSDSDYSKIIKKTKSKGKKFGVAIADVSKISFFESLDVDFYKIIRNDINNENLTDELIKTEKKLIVSTGTASESEIQTFIKKYKNSNFVINHTQISHDINDSNLKAIKSLKKKFGTEISYGNHCNNFNILYMALAFEPSDILFYVKENSVDKFPDDEHAIPLNDVGKLINNMKSLEKALGDGKKEKMEIKI